MQDHLLLAVLICVIAILVVLGYGLYKIRRFQRLMRHSIGANLPAVFSQIVDKQFSQLEALAGIFLELGLKKSLPPTRGWAASPDFLREIASHARHSRPNAIAECGSGVSTVVLARCLQLNKTGHIFSLEHNPEYAERTRQELEKHSLSDWATVLTAPLSSYQLNGEVVSWYSLDELPNLGFDMLVIDGPPSHIGKLARYPAGLLLFGRLNAQGAVFLDDAFRQDEQIILQRWAEEFTDLRQEIRNCEKGCAILWKDGSRSQRGVHHQADRWTKINC